MDDVPPRAATRAARLRYWVTRALCDHPADFSRFMCTVNEQAYGQDNEDIRILWLCHVDAAGNVEYTQLCFETGISGAGLTAVPVHRLRAEFPDGRVEQVDYDAAQPATEKACAALADEWVRACVKEERE